MQAYAGVSVPGFPNFFLSAGPYSGGFNWFTTLKANLVHIMGCIDDAHARGATRVEVKREVHGRYMRHMWRRADGTVFKGRLVRVGQELLRGSAWRRLAAFAAHPLVARAAGASSANAGLPLWGRVMASILSPFYRWTERSPDQLLYAFLDVEGRIAESYSYAQFLQRTTDIASHIRRTHPMAAAERVLLAYPPGLEMICAFAACVRLGLIPVPVYPSTSQGLQAALDKTDFIARDCQAAAVLTARSYYWSMKLNEARNSVATLSLRRSKASRLKWIVSTDADKGARADFSDVHSDVLFLQYTSGSTSEPKGVMVTHENILENCEAVVDHRPVGVSWLPQYHDMGLIGYYLFSR